MKCMKWFSPPFFAEDFAAWVVWFQYVSDQWAGFTSDRILRPFDHKMITKLGRCWRGQLPHCKTPAVIIALSAEGPTCEAGGFQWSSLSRLRGWSFIIYIYIHLYPSMSSMQTACRFSNSTDHVRKKKRWNLPQPHAMTLDHPWNWRRVAPNFQGWNWEVLNGVFQIWTVVKQRLRFCRACPDFAFAGLIT